MANMNECIDRLTRRRKDAIAMGGEQKIKRQHEQGKLTARERIGLLLDSGSFQEYGMLASHAGQKPGEDNTPADGLVAGVGKVDGRSVCVFAEDATVLGGSVGEINGHKRMRMINIASRERVPLIALLDGVGFRAQSMLHSTEGAPAIGHILAFARLSGISPTLALVLGPCAGEPALEAALAEFLIMVKGTGMLAAGGPPVVKASTGQEVTKEDLGGVSVHGELTGMVDTIASTDREAIEAAKRYLSYLPTNAWCYPPSIESAEAKPGSDNRIIQVLPESSRKAYDMLEVINCVIDADSFFETKASYGAALITGFARLNGHSVGIIASQPCVKAGAISGPEGQKARKFVELCNAYHLPLISLTDTPGVMTGPEAERQGSLKYGLAAAYALAWADVPVFSVILRKAFGFGGGLMAGSHGPQTVTLAWPSVEFSSLPPESAIAAAHAKELAEADDPAVLKKKLLEGYAAFSGPYPAAGIMNIDDVIDPRETRSRLIQALELSMTRRTQSVGPNFRHGVMP